MSSDKLQARAEFRLPPGRLASEAKLRGESLYGLARASGIPYATCSRINRGMAFHPSSARKLADWLEANPIDVRLLQLAGQGV